MRPCGARRPPNNRTIPNSMFGMPLLELEARVSNPVPTLPCVVCNVQPHPLLSSTHSCHLKKRAFLFHIQWTDTFEGLCLRAFRPDFYFGRWHGAKTCMLFISCCFLFPPRLSSPQTGANIRSSFGSEACLLIAFGVKPFHDNSCVLTLSLASFIHQTSALSNCLSTSLRVHVSCLCTYFLLCSGLAQHLKCL